jgi:DNA-binding transcriptional ArsR family regulator
LLESVGAYLSFLETNYPYFDPAIETEAYTLFIDPPRMQDVIVTHLRTMWEQVLAAEWERVLPMLQESVNAFSQLDLAGLTGLEAARQILGQDRDGDCPGLIADARQIIFAPSAHLGPYIGKFREGETLWILFGARLPDGVQARSSALSRSDLLVRLGAVTDDTRLRILELLSQQGEQCAQDIIMRLDLTQSAVSRHLRQLSATGYVAERRRDGAKCYSLKRERIGDTFRAFERFLDGA